MSQMLISHASASDPCLFTQHLRRAHLAPLRKARLVQRPRQAAQLLAPALQQPPAYRLCTVGRLL